MIRAARSAVRFDPQRCGGLRLRTAIAMLACCSAALPASAQETTDYVVSNYELTVELQPANAAARVTMDLTYQIGSGTKSEGFKYIGTFQPTQVEGTEADGRPMSVSVERQRETLIKWRFTPAGRGEKRVRVSFTLPATVAGTLAQNLFRANWAGVFKVPVNHAIYRLVLPQGWTEARITTEPAEFRRTTYQGRPALEIEQQPLGEPRFSATFSPGIADTSQATVPMSSSQRGSARSDRGGGNFIGYFVLLLLIVAIIGAASRAKRGKGRSGDVTSGSSCAGGASCSSGCGGGGCGGGCGG